MAGLRVKKLAVFGRLLLILSILSTPFSAQAQSGYSAFMPLNSVNYWPVFTYQVNSQLNSPAELGAPTDFKPEPMKYTVSVVQVPAAEEDSFVRQLARSGSAQPGRRDQLVMVYPESSAYAAELEAYQQANTERGFVAYPLGKDQVFPAPEMANTLGQSSSPADATAEKSVVRRGFSPEGVERAGTWVAIAGTGITSAMLYISFAVEPATAASLLVAFLVTFNVKRFQTMLNYYGRGKNLGESVARKLAPQSDALASAGGFAGKAGAGLIYHFITNGMLKLALNWGDVEKSFGSVQALSDLATMTAFNVLSGSMWEMAFAKMSERNKGPQAKKVITLFNYGNRIFLTAAGTLLFIPSAHLAGMSILGVYGAIGFVANVKEQPFFDFAERVVTRMENSVIVSRALAGLMKVPRKTRSCGAILN